VFLRRGHSSDDALIAAFNFTPEPRHNHRIGVPGPGTWREILNSDAPLYGGSGQGNLGEVTTHPVASRGHAQSVVITLPPLGMVLLKGRVG
ncbi:MAG: alpha amylase C-terminal domain-containing protein, partial [Myxococcales bacterium]|nr:alpha amylase C-terminal domain-containing protein [Myxococcales bacterium]